MARDEIAGPDNGPESPYPIKINGPVIRGFGRGSKELGIPTANIPVTGAKISGRDIPNGVYYGWAGLSFASATADSSRAPLPPAPKEITETDAKHHEPGHIHDTRSSPSNAHRAPGGEPAVEIYPMCMSIGWNPYYKNELRTVEVHIMHKFKQDFYNALMNLSIVGYIRPEQNYDSMQALIDDINFDIEVAKKSLAREAYQELKKDSYLTDFAWGNDRKESKV